MSGKGAPPLEVDGTGFAVDIVASSWHDEIVGGLIVGAEEVCQKAGAEVRLIRVPGCFELPVVAEKLARNGSKAIVALGVVIRGDTPHFEYVAGAATRGLAEVARSHAVAVGFGLLTCDTEEQARARAGFADSKESKGGEAAEAAIAVAKTLENIG